MSQQVDSSSGGTRTLIEHLDFALTVDPADSVLRDASILVEDRRIADVGTTADVLGRLGGAPVHHRIDARGLGAIPGLVDSHVHLSETLSRAVFPDVLATRADRKSVV